MDSFIYLSALRGTDHFGAFFFPATLHVRSVDANVQSDKLGDERAEDVASSMEPDQLYMDRLLRDMQALVGNFEEDAASVGALKRVQGFEFRL